MKLIQLFEDKVTRHKGDKIIDVPSMYYHKSPPVCRDDIMKDGLLCKIGDSYSLHNDSLKDNEEILPAVFASPGKEYDSTYDDDIWEIDTKIANVDWYVDIEAPDAVMTFQDIPAKALKLIYEGTGEDML